MGRNKSGKFKKKESNPPKKSSNFFNEDDDMMNDEIDAFHKQRDVVPLDIDEDVGSSDEDDEYPVFDLKDNDDEDSDEADEDSEEDKGLAAKILRQKRYLQSKIVEAEDDDNSEEEEEDKSSVWGKNPSLYYNGDDADLEDDEDEEAIAMEEAEALRMHRDKVKALSMEDFGLEDTIENESDEEPTFEESLRSGKPAPKTSEGQQPNKDADTTIYEKVKKDLKALTREEQMDVVYSSAPEIVGLLSELNNAFEQLENKVDPLLSKVIEGKDGMRGGMHYLELKKMLLLSYCQAITFYLLLKSEGLSARDHPVISQLVQMKTLMDKMNELDQKIPTNFEDILNKSIETEDPMKLVEENVMSDVSSAGGLRPPVISSGAPDLTEPVEVIKKAYMDSSRGLKESVPNSQHPDTKVGIQSREMLKVRAANEERLKKKGVFSSLAQRNDKLKRSRQLINGQLETMDDFDDDALGVDARAGSINVSRLVNPQMKKHKMASGDDDLPKRDDIGERRRNNELRVLARTGTNSADDLQDEIDDAVSDHSLGGDSDTDLKVYKQVERERAAKMAAKSGIYARPSTIASLPEPIVDGKRQISHQIEKNRGLTRSRNKDKKNPRKNYRDKHKKKVVSRKGQVREHKTLHGPYGGETAGINAGISRSVRF